MGFCYIKLIQFCIEKQEVIEMAKIVEFKDILLEDLVIGMNQARSSNDAKKDLDDLKNSIQKKGLLEPILVAPSGSGDKYEIILGQRRFLAHRELNKETIMAGILDEHLDEIDAKVLSVTENLVRRDMNSKDLIDVCTHLYKHYGTVEAVVEETGLSKTKVDQYVKYDRLIPDLKKVVDSGESNLQAALRAQDALATEGEPDPQESVKLAKEMSSMSGAQQKRVQKELKDRPTESVDEVIEEAKSGGKVTQVVITLLPNIHNALKLFANAEGTTMDEAASRLIEDGLSTSGYDTNGDIE